MNLKIAELKSRQGEPLPFRTTLEPADLKNRHQEIRGLTPVETVGEAVMLGGLVYVTGKLSADVDFVCARCLGPFRQHVQIPFQETFATSDADVQEDGDSDFHEVAGDEIDLEPILQEDFLLAIPAFPLCMEDCKGLCPTCGANRNEQTCSCNNQRIDPRLAGLADFFSKTEE
ncbi:YceD family protein [Brevibacillus massiliensis]|uniref:YceD family protein n=1 Tax=Brevibacillus massiliensis TaxID=1118054 RepID=UPI000311C958|nr:DUF177 domain-containing protein [Brevibacillus massiliensis]